MAIRERQLEAHLLQSPEYLRRCDQTIKRQVTMLYLAIALLIFVQGIFTLKTAGQIPPIAVVLTTVTSLLAIVNCLLLIRTKSCLRHLNDSWLKPEEKSAVNALRHQRTELLGQQLASGEARGAQLN